MRPIAHPLHQAMLHGIVVNVIDMPGKVVIVANRVLPTSPLPKRKLAIGVALNVLAGIEQAPAEVSFDAPPSGREV